MACGRSLAASSTRVDISIYIYLYTYARIYPFSILPLCTYAYVAEFDSTYMVELCLSVLLLYIDFVSRGVGCSNSFFRFRQLAASTDSRKGYIHSFLIPIVPAIYIYVKYSYVHVAERCLNWGGWCHVEQSALRKRSSSEYLWCLGYYELFRNFESGIISCKLCSPGGFIGLSWVNGEERFVLWESSRSIFIVFTL